MVAVLYCFLNGEVGDVNTADINTPQYFHTEIACSRALILRKCSLSVVSPSLPVRTIYIHTQSWQVDGAAGMSHRRLSFQLLSWTSPQHIFCTLPAGWEGCKKHTVFLAGSYSVMSAQALCGQIIYVLSAGPDWIWAGWRGFTLCCLNFNLMQLPGVLY